MVMTVTFALATLSLLTWMVLVLFRGGFWRADQRLEDEEHGEPAAKTRWPSTVAVVPARNEAPSVGRTVAALLAQNYPGGFAVVVVDDGSDDGTAEAASRSGQGSDRLTVVTGTPLEPGWTGKLWALSQGLKRAEEQYPAAAYVLFCDADIECAPHTLRRLVAKAETSGLDLVSVMARLNCESVWERLLIPAFVFFFQKLYPFQWVNDRRRPEAAAAGGCMLARRSGLAAAGGVEAIRGRIIDDCALAANMKRGGAIWLGFSGGVRSIRSYDRLAEIWGMVARTAFTQLRHSAWRLAATVAGMTVLYLAPPVTVVVGFGAGQTWPVLVGLVAWLVMTFSYWPTLRLYEQPAAMAPLLPLAALLFTLMTADSARRHWRGRGGAWKGRIYGGAATDG